jgi:hypothetical protein
VSVASRPVLAIPMNSELKTNTGDVVRRNTAIARIWTSPKDPLVPAELADDLTGRGFVPGITDSEFSEAAKNASGLAEVELVVDGPALRFLSLSSSRGNGVRLSLVTLDERNPPPDHQSARPIARRGGHVYVVEALGPGNSDRNLCENLAEAIMERTGGVVQISGRGVKGNRPTVYTSPWLGIYAG